MTTDWILAITFTLLVIVLIAVPFIRLQLIARRALDLDSVLPKDSSKPLIPESEFLISIDNDRVTCTRPDGRSESFQWDSLIKVEIMTTSDGPFAPDVFWVFHDDSGAGAVIPSGATGEDQLMDKALELPGFDSKAFIESQSSTSEARFPVWQRSDSGEA